MVALVSSSGFQFCGGTLVASKYVISAAHCMFTDQALTQARPLSELKVWNSILYSNSPKHDNNYF